MATRATTENEENGCAFSVDAVWMLRHMLEQIAAICGYFNAKKDKVGEKISKNRKSPCKVLLDL